MAVTVRVWGEVRATVANGQWKCEDPGLLMVLRALREGSATFLPTQAGEEDSYLAVEAARLMGGEVLSSDGCSSPEPA